MRDQQGKTVERERRDWIVILVILLFGFLCLFLAGGWAVRLAPRWRLDTSMKSNLDPDSDFLTNRPVSYYEPLDPSILTRPAWADIYLTPGADFQTRLPPANPPTRTSTPLPTPVNSPTATRLSSSTPVVILPSPTRTSPYFPPATSTATPRPATSTPVTPATTQPPAPTANLRITMSDNTTTYTVGGTITYTITASHMGGTANVTGATVIDNFPAQLTNITWTCTGAGGGTCPASGTGNLNASVNLPVGSSVTFVVNASVSPAATGNLVNTATVNVPVGITDPSLANNTATDTNTPVFNVNLQITKTDGAASYTPGSPVTYTIAVTNAGPANVSGATVTDNFPAVITSASWTCASTGGATCPPNGNGNLADTVNIPVGGSLTYTVTAATNPAATTDLVNTASVSAPGGYTETDPSDNSATDVDTPGPAADLRITKTNNSTHYVASATKTYLIVVTNAGPSNVTGATVTDNFSANPNIAGASWICSSAGGAACTSSGSGDINDSVNLPAGSSVTYTVTANVSASPSGDLDNTAAVTAPAGVTDPLPGNNFANDTDSLIVEDPLPPAMGTRDNVFYTLPSGSTLTLNINLTANGDAAWDLVFYEYSVSPMFEGIWLDWIIIEISDGNNWYRVFYWGDNIRDTNTNVDYVLLTVPVTPPDPEEVDQRPVASGDLYPYPGTGIAIDIDSIVPPGTYTYIRFYAPPGDVDGGAEIDAIEILP